MKKKNPMRATGHCPDELVHYYDIFNGPGNCVATSISRLTIGAYLRL